MRALFLLLLGFTGTNCFANGLISNDYYIKVHASDLFSVQKIRNCIQYTTCLPFHQTIETLPDHTYNVSLRLDTSETEILNLFNGCAIAPSAIQVTRHLLPVNLHFNLNPGAATNRTDGNAIKLEPESVTQVKKHLPEIDALLKNKNYMEAVKLITKTLNLNLHDYSFQFNDVSTFPGFITDSGTKHIVFTTASVNGIPTVEVVRLVRHEAEHIHQKKMVDSCRNPEEADLANHNNRELSAHLNDLINFDLYCEDIARRIFERKGIMTAIVRYLKFFQ